VLTVIPGAVTLRQLHGIWSSETAVKLDAATHSDIETAADLVRRTASGDDAVYGVNTGFGKLASVRIPSEDTKTLQRNLVLSHCCGVGDNTPIPVVRLMMALKLISLGRGASGVSLELVALLEAMLAKGVYPVVPAQGSVGASGDLAPLAHMAAVMIGEGQAWFDGQTCSGAEALKAAGLSPIELGPKEGLALINGTQFSTAYALAGLFQARLGAATSLVSCAMSIDAAMASTSPLIEEIHTLRGHPGQIAAAATMRHLLESSEIRESHREDDTRVQDPYCMRCHPQVVGAAIDMLGFAATSLIREANAATDNPLVLTERETIVSGGNFHAELVAFAADMIALAIAEIGAISQRRIALLVDPTLSFDLPAFLTANPGLNSGLMIAEVTSAALMSENKHLANPCSTDSTPTSANQEDHVSMAAHGARRLERMAQNLFQILGIEMLCGRQGIGFRAPLQTSERLSAVVQRLDQDITPLGDDRYLAEDLKRAAALVGSGVIVDPSHMQALSFEELNS
jgi:histidine ammonia-lyase